jgi:hypothetical protein
MTFTRLTSSLALLACAILAVSAGPASAQLRTKSGAITKFDGADNNNSACTGSSNFKNLPSMAVTFTQGGAGADEVAVLFEGAGWFVEQLNFVGIRLTIDGVVQPGPGAGDDTFIFGGDPATDTGGTTSHGFNFQTEALSPGTHVARIQWRSFDGSEACVGPRSLLVLHR